jgi:hypothetical protein
VKAAVRLRIKSGYGGEKLDLRDEKYQVRENYLMRWFINCTLYVIPFYPMALQSFCWALAAFSVS